MKNRVMMLFALLLMVAGVHAQKIDQRLTQLVEQSNARRAQGLSPLDAQGVNKVMSVVFRPDGSISELSAIATLKEGAECPTAQLEQLGCEVRFVIGDMVALYIPADKLGALEQIDEIRYVKADMKDYCMNDVARGATNVDKVNTTAAATAQQLPKAYTGQGVVLGIIDSGIDYNHAAFRNADGTTRIVKAIRYEKNSEGKYVKHVYDTPEEILALTFDSNENSHGTHTSATAGGSITGNGYEGMAPQVDLILCGLGENLANTNEIECIKDIFAYATSVGKPAVVSVSLGNIIGLHDGSDIVGKAVNEVTENGTKPGRAVLFSAGNSAANWQSIIKKMDNTTDELKTLLGSTTAPTKSKPNQAVTYTGMYMIYADDYKTFDLELKVVNIKTGEMSEVGNHLLKKGTTEPYTMKLLYYMDDALDGRKAFNYWFTFGSQPVEMDDVDLRLALVAKAGTAGQTIKMMCNGDSYYEPCFDAPNDEGCYNFAANGWTKGHSDFAFNISICSDAVISVGAFNSRVEWTSYDNQPQKYLESIITNQLPVVGEIADFSSYGTDDNGKPRPTVLGAGQGIISAASNYDSELFVSGQPGTPISTSSYFLIAKQDLLDRPNWYVLEQGTSMSCPQVAGIVALWMQAKPTLTANDIKDIMKQTCLNDEFTTNTAKIPSGNKIQAGFGKIDCLAGLKQILGTTDIETVGLDGRREATPATMYSIDAPVYNMMGQQVDKSQKGLVIYKGRKYLNK